MGPSVLFDRTKFWLLAISFACGLVAVMAANNAWHPDRMRPSLPERRRQRNLPPNRLPHGSNGGTYRPSRQHESHGRHGVGHGHRLLVFFMNLGFAAWNPACAGRRTRVNILSKNFIVFAVTTIFFWLLGWGIMFGNGNAATCGTEGLWFVGGADNSPAMGDAYKGDYSAISLDRRAADGQVLLPTRVRRNGCDDRLRGGRRAHQVSVVHRVQLHHGDRYLPGGGPLDLGRRLAGDQRLPRFRRLARRCTRSAAGRPWSASIMLGPRIGKYCGGRQAQRHSGPQHDGRHDRLLDPLVRLVRLQPGQHDGRRCRTRSAHICVTTNMAAAAATLTRDGYLLDHARQAGLGHDAQRLPGRPGGHHRLLCVRQRNVVGHHRRDRRRAGGVRGDRSSTASRPTIPSVRRRSTW